MSQIIFQWKGRDICGNFLCNCGNEFHIDYDFVYTIGCTKCETIWEVPTKIKLKPYVLNLDLPFHDVTLTCSHDWVHQISYVNFQSKNWPHCPNYSPESPCFE